MLQDRRARNVTEAIWPLEVKGGKCGALPRGRCRTIRSCFRNSKSQGCLCPLRSADRIHADGFDGDELLRPAAHDARHRHRCGAGGVGCGETFSSFEPDYFVPEEALHSALRNEACSTCCTSTAS